MGKVNLWTARSLAWASKRDYLDQLFGIYPMQANLKRFVPDHTLQRIAQYFDEKASDELVKLLLKQEIFPIKDSYIAYLKRDPKALARNPRTLARISGMLYSMGLSQIIDNICAPKETNRQIGPLFKNWLGTGALGCKITHNEEEFINSSTDIIFLHSDTMMKKVAQLFLGYDHEKGLDFLAKFNGKFVLGEAKFISDFGGHQTTQFNDAIATLEAPLLPTSHIVIKIAILDGVVYIRSNNKIHRDLLHYARLYPIMSALTLRDYLYTL